MIYEVLHKYLDEDIDNNDLILLDKTSNILKNSLNLNKDNKLVLLLDDIHINERRLDLSNLRSTLYSYFPNFNISFYYESKMTDFLDIFIEKFNPFLLKEYFRKENKYVYYTLIDNEKYFLYEYFIESGKIKAYCLFLSYIWCLYKIFGFNNENFINYIVLNKYSSNNLIKNVLIIDKKYSIIEDKVLKLIKYIDDDIINYIKLEYI